MTRKPGRFQCVLFDLDGTLVDTAPDMVGALNGLRTEAGLAELPMTEVRHLASHGTGALLLAGFPDINAEDRKVLARGFIDAYLARICEASRLFPGVEGLLHELDAAAIPWGVVTNKPKALTQPLLQALELRPSCVVAGDSLPERKPDPAPVLHACRQCDIHTHSTLYVGDAERDVQAAAAAGAHSAVALWGYLDAAEDPRLWRADYYLDSPDALKELIFSGNAARAAC